MVICRFWLHLQFKHPIIYRILLINEYAIIYYCTFQHLLSNLCIELCNFWEFICLLISTYTFLNILNTCNHILETMILIYTLKWEKLSKYRWGSVEIIWVHNIGRKSSTSITLIPLDYSTIVHFYITLTYYSTRYPIIATLQGLFSLI